MAMDPVPEVKISVITVCRNSAATVEKTIKSVLEQTYGNIQYIIIDGNSDDGSAEIFARYRSRIDVLVSEPDRGIYDAMNKGIGYATGNWVCFMNANDRFHDEKVLADIFSDGPGDDIIYGYCIDPADGRSIKPLPLEKFWKRIPMNHQSAFVRTEYHRQYPFDLRYRISSVYDFFYHWYCQGLRFRYIDRPVAVYDMTGLSFYAFEWLWDYIRIAMKYSRGKWIRVVFRFLYMVMVRIWINLFKR